MHDCQLFLPVVFYTFWVQVGIGWRRGNFLDLHGYVKLLVLKNVNVTACAGND